MPWLTVTIVAIFGVVLLLFGIRGRRIDDHPLCRRCRFDLVGIHPGVQQCPECGHVLVRDGADVENSVRTGNRQVRRGAVAVGGGMLAIALFATVFVAWAGATSFDWNTVQPAWLLVRELQAKDSATADAATAELRRRVEDAALTLAQAQAVADAVLAMQADLNRPWLESAGKLFEDMWAQGLLDDERIVRYVENAWPWTIEVRRIVVQGDPLPVRLKLENRTGSFGMAAAGGALLDLIVDGKRVDGERHSFYTSVNDRGRLSPRMPAHTIDLVPVEVRPAAEGDGWIDVALDLPPGRYNAKTVWLSAAGVPIDSRPGIWFHSSRAHLPLPGPELIPREEDLEYARRSIGRLEGISTRVPSSISGLPILRIRESCFEIEVVPADEDTVALIADESLRDAVRQAVRVQVDKTPLFLQDQPPVQVDVFISAPPVPVAFEVLWVLEGRETVLGSIAVEPQMASVFTKTHQSRLEEPENGYPENITIILRPSTRLARRTVDMERIWGEELVFEVPCPRLSD